MGVGSATSANLTHFGLDSGLFQVFQRQLNRRLHVQIADGTASCAAAWPFLPWHIEPSLDRVSALICIQSDSTTGEEDGTLHAGGIEIEGHDLGTGAMQCTR